METLKRLCMGIVLTLTLTLPAFAEGHMETGSGVTTPPPAPTSSITQGNQEAPSGDMSAGVAPTTEAGSLTEAVLSLLEGVLSLL